MWEITRVKLEKARKEKGLTYEAIAAKVGYSDSSIQRWLMEPKKDSSIQKAPKSAPPYDVVVEIADFVGCDINEINAAVGAQEMQVAQAIDYMGTEALLRQMEVWKVEHSHHCETIVEHQKELRLLDATHHAQIVGKMGAEITYLKRQVDRFRITAVIFLVLFILSLVFTVYLVAADIPELGAGGSVAPQGATPLGFVRLVTVPLLILLLAAVTFMLFNAKRKARSDEPFSATVKTMEKV